MVITYSKGRDQPGKIANPARGQLNRGNVCMSCMVITYSTGRHQPGEVANPARGQLNNFYMHIWSSHIARVGINRVWLPILLVVS